MMWSQALRNGTGFYWGIRCLSLVSQTIVQPRLVCQSYKIESHILT